MPEVTFTVDVTDPAAAYTALPEVGHVYEIGINGEGYMLWDRDLDSPETEYRRQTVPLDPQRFATGETPFNQAVERYSFIGLSDFSGGAGQKQGSRELSAENRFWDSDGVNPFDPNELTLLHEVDLGVNTYTALRSVVIGTRLYVQTGAKQLSYYDTVAAVTSATPTGTLTIAAATTIEDLCTDGVYWYAACGAQGIFRGTTTDPGAAWSAQQAFVVDFVAGRIAAAVIASGSTPNRWTTLNSSGAEEVASGRVTLNAGTTITKATSGSGKVWFGAHAGDKGWAYVWAVDATTPSVALESLPGLAVRSCWYAEGQVMVRMELRSSTTAARAIIYRCPIEAASGLLTPFALVELDTPAATDHGPGAFGGSEDLVFFSWKDMDGTNDGIGAVSLTSGGYSKWFKGGAGTGELRAIVRWQNRIVFTLDGVGIYVEDLETFLTTGYVTTSTFDLGSTLSKVYDYISLVSAPLGASEAIEVSYSTDQLVSFSTHAASDLDTVGAIRKRTAFEKKATTLGLKLTLTGPGASAPTLTLVQIQHHPLGLADTLIQLPINCSDEVTTLQGRPMPNQLGPGSGISRAKALEGLVQSRILFQDLDYPATQLAEIFEVLNVDIRSVHVPNRSNGRLDIFPICIITARKSAR